MSVVVSDTSPLHYLIECDAVEILPALFHEALIPPTVHREMQQPKTPRASGPGLVPYRRGSKFKPQQSWTIP